MERTPPPKIPSASVQYHRDLVSTNSYLQTEWRQDRLAALNVEQPDGPSFAVNDRQVEWQKWKFRVGFNYREGLVLHDVSYDGRPILHRGSLVEMAVPYKSIFVELRSGRVSAEIGTGQTIGKGVVIGYRIGSVG